MDVEDKSHLYVVNLYRPPQMRLSILQTSLCQILSCIPAESRVILIGDFNVNPSSNDHLLHVMRPLEKFNIVLKVTAPTHRLGFAVGHVCVSSSFSTASTLVVPMYFTDHSAIVITVPLSLSRGQMKIPSATSSQNLTHRRTDKEKIRRFLEKQFQRKRDKKTSL